MDRNNILATISDLKAELVRIEATKHQIDSTIKTLTTLLENPLFVGGTAVTPSTKVKSVRTKFPAPQTQVEGPIPSDRVLSALKQMHGRFKRGELRDNAINDGNGPIAEGTFANIFIKLVKRNQIVRVEGKMGQRDAVFIKADESKEQSIDPFNLTFG